MIKPETVRLRGGSGGQRSTAGSAVAKEPGGIGLGRRMRNRTLALIHLLCMCCLSAAFDLSCVRLCVAENEPGRICRPQPTQTPAIELGQAGQFRWTCSGGTNNNKRYYIVFVRPSGTYVLLKVPEGRTSFEFAPDTAGKWRWIVINTDPDRTKPDRESQPSYFEVSEKDAPD